MSTHTMTEAELAALLTYNGLSLTPEQVRALLPGAEIFQGLIEKVNTPLPREAELAITFEVEQR